MIDAQGYRANVAIVILNRDGKAFWGKRIGQTSWQFPQGGVNEGELPLTAMYRELYEEVGLRPQDVELMAVTPGWLKYRLPKKLVRSSSPTCIGQKQKWFLLKLVGDESNIQFDRGQKAEFDGWRWVNYWYPLKQVIYFKREVYRRALRYFVRYQRQLAPPKQREERDRTVSLKNKRKNRLFSRVKQRLPWLKKQKKGN